MARTWAIWCLLAVTSLSLTGRAGGRLPASALGAANDGRSAAVDFDYPFNDSKSPVMKTTATIDGDTLVIELEEAKGFKKYAMGFDFRGVMDGTEDRYRDSDAAQITVLWKDIAGNPIGRTTNATPQLPVRSTTKPAAVWKAIAEASPAKLAWEVRIPDDATDLEIVSVYTDTLTNPPYSAAKDRNRKNQSGDMPLIVASFAATRVDEGSWLVTARPEDVEETRKFEIGAYPTVAQIEATVSAVQTRLLERTGYQLVTRPNRLKGISAPIDIGYRELQKLLDDAIDAKEITNRLDTGFDVVPE